MAEASVTTTGPARRVLLVEDEAAIRELLRLHLSLAGFAVEQSGDGQAALERLRTTPYDLVVLDVMLPGIDGITLCRTIRAQGGVNGAAPVLMLTALDTESDTVLGLESGGDDYLTKPKLLPASTASTDRRSPSASASVRLLATVPSFITTATVWIRRHSRAM